MIKYFYDTKLKEFWRSEYEKSQKKSWRLSDKELTKIMFLVILKMCTY